MLENKFMEFGKEELFLQTHQEKMNDVQMIVFLDDIINKYTPVVLDTNNGLNTETLRKIEGILQTARKTKKRLEGNILIDQKDTLH